MYVMVLCPTTQCEHNTGHMQQHFTERLDLVSQDKNQTILLLRPGNFSCAGSDEELYDEELIQGNSHYYCILLLC